MPSPTQTQPEETNRAMNPFVGLLGLGLIVAGIWVWHHLNFDTQDYIVDEILPIIGAVVALGIGAWSSGGNGAPAKSAFGCATASSNDFKKSRPHTNSEIWRLPWLKSINSKYKAWKNSSNPWRNFLFGP